MNYTFLKNKVIGLLVVFLLIGNCSRSLAFVKHNPLAIGAVNVTGFAAVLAYVSLVEKKPLTVKNIKQVFKQALSNPVEYKALVGALLSLGIFNAKYITYDLIKHFKAQKERIADQLKQLDEQAKAQGVLIATVDDQKKELEKTKLELQNEIRGRINTQKVQRKADLAAAVQRGNEEQQLLDTKRALAVCELELKKTLQARDELDVEVSRLSQCLGQTNERIEDLKMSGEIDASTIKSLIAEKQCTHDEILAVREELDQEKEIKSQRDLELARLQVALDEKHSFVEKLLGLLHSKRRLNLISEVSSDSEAQQISAFDQDETTS